MQTINIDSAIAAHKAWVKRLELHLDGLLLDRLNLDDVRNPRVCVLGQWLYGGGQALSGLASFDPLEQEHRKFHELAADVLRLDSEGAKADAQHLLTHTFQQQSDRVVDLLQQLKAQLLARPGP